MAKKVLLIGRAGMGKTTIKELIFEGKNSKDLMIHPLEPTRGITPSIYTWMDVTVGLFDTSGQELPYLLEDENEQKKAFENSNSIIYIFDYPIWASQTQEIIKEIQKIFEILKRNCEKAKLFLFFHKIDLINQKVKGTFTILENQIRKLLNLPIELKIFFTSLRPNLIYRTYNAFFEVLSEISEEIMSLKKIVNFTIKDASKTICFITNQNNNILVQIISPDFDINLISQMQQKIILMVQKSDESADNNYNVNLLDAGSKIVRYIMSNLENISSKFKNIIIISETLSENELKDMLGKVREEISNFYNLNELKSK